MVGSAAKLTTMVPPVSALPDVLPTAKLTEHAKLKAPRREELRRIDNQRNIATLLGALLQSVGVVVAAGIVHTWWAYLLALALMARGHAVLNILAHEAAHRLLFTRNSSNDFAGRWLLGYPSFQPTLTYRRIHFAHHKDELGPKEPDIGLYRGYPISGDSMGRKLTRDALGISAAKNFRGLGKAMRSGQREAWQIMATQLVLLGASVVVGRPLMYLVWIVSWSTVWKVSNRLRAIAEHGGMKRSVDRRQTTHVVRQTLLARYWIVPYNTGWHLAHHVDMGVPWRHLPELHHELVASGWVTPEIEYRTYRALWRQLASGEQRR